MSLLLEMVKKQIPDMLVDGMSESLGTDKKTMETIVNGALPVLVGALGKNASSDNGAESLFKALVKDHSGSALDKPENILDDNVDTKGSNILSHVLGSQQKVLADFLSKNTGLSPAMVSKGLEMLAPALMGSLGKYTVEKGFDSSMLSNLLKEDKKSIEQTSGMEKILTGILDSDGDGEVMDDLANLGMDALKKFF